MTKTSAKPPVLLGFLRKTAEVGLRELGIEEPSPEEAYRDFACAMACGILEETISELEACQRLADAYRGDMGRLELQPFWLLDLALEEGQAGDIQRYDPRFTGDNFENLIRLEAAELSDTMCRDETRQTDSPAPART